MSSNRAARETSARLLLATAHPDRHAFEQALVRASTPIDWPWLVERAGVHKLGALLARRIAEVGGTLTLPDVVAAKLEAIRTQAAIRATRAQRTLQAVAKAFAAENVDFLLVKGGVLAEHVYEDPAIRPFYDIDILVRDEALDKAERALKSTGLLNACATVRHLRSAGLAAERRARVVRRRGDDQGVLSSFPLSSPVLGARGRPG